QAASPNRFRGIRHSVARDPHSEIDNAVEPHYIGDLRSEAFRAGARVLARRGLTFDAWLFHHQMDDLVDFARAVPDLPIVLDHVGGPLRVGPYADRLAEVEASWRASIAALARCPNVVVKLGGFGMPRYGFGFELREVPVGSEELAETVAPWLSYCIEQFGPERCMFESNFPVDRVSFSYGVMWNAFKRFSSSYTSAERAAMFHDTAARFYRLDV
ncbi:MAG: amidohydrolase family protein, partial [Chloroflexi bacterium]|nr:amidohydrolase family protein [Chloroflexota bacterium]